MAHTSILVAGWSEVSRLGVYFGKWTNNESRAFRSFQGELELPLADMGTIQKEETWGGRKKAQSEAWNMLFNVVLSSQSPGT